MENKNMSAFVAGGYGRGPAHPCRRPSSHCDVMRGRAVVTAAAKPLKVSTDMKGKPVWTLRVATAADVGKIAEMEPKMPLSDELVASIIKHGADSSLVAQVTLKSGESETVAAALSRPDDPKAAQTASESSSSKIVGVVLADVHKSFVNPENGPSSPLKSRGDIVALKVDSRMPESEDVRRKLLLGSLRKLKMSDVIDTYVTMSSEDMEAEELFSNAGFSKSKSEEGYTTMYANLVGMSPDPEKKIV